MCKLKRLPVIISTLTIAFTYNTNAEEVEHLLNLSLEELLETPIATATKTAKTLPNIPSSITVFTDEDIDTLQINYLHDLLNLVPGFQIHRSADYSFQSNISARGRNYSSATKDILFLIDGQTVNSPRTGSDVGMYQYRLANVERVEVIRGPGSALYGSNALSGIINIITKQDNSETAISYGNLLDYTIDHAMHFNVKNIKFNIHGSLTKDGGDSYRVKDSFTNAMIDTRDSFHSRQVHLTASKDNSKAAINYRHITGEGFYNTERTSNDINESQQHLLSANAEHMQTIHEDISAKFHISYIDLRTKNTNQSTAEGVFALTSSPPSDEPLWGVGYLDSSRINGGIFIDATLSEFTSIQTGIDLTRNKVERAEGRTNFDANDLRSGNFPIRFYPNLSPTFELSQRKSQKIVGLYTQVQHVRGPWDVLAGFRYDDYDLSGSRISPRLSVIYTPQDSKSNVKFLYGEAFRAPNLNENYFSALTRVGNPDLAQEVVKTSEFIYQYIDDTFVLTTNLFSNHYESPIIDGIIDNKNSYVNSTNENSFGIEGELKYLVSDSTWLRAAYTAYIDLPDSATGESDRLFNFQYNQRWNNFSLNITTIFHNASDRIPKMINLIPKDYWLTNLNMSYALQDNVTLYLSGHNLFDKTYYSLPITNGIIDGIPSRGAEVIAKIKWKF